MSTFPLNQHTSTPTNIAFTLAKGVSLSGKVLGLTAGQRATVSASSVGTAHETTTETEADGTYTLNGLHPVADYRVTVAAAGYVTQVRAVASFASSSDFILVTGGRIEGSLTGLVAHEVATITARSLRGDCVAETTVVATGGTAVAYVLDGLADATDYMVTLKTARGHFYYSPLLAVRRPAEAASVAIVDHSTVSWVDFDIGTAKSYTLSGNIAAATAGEMVWIRVWSEDDSGETFRYGNGPWMIAGLAAGSYQIAVSTPSAVDLYYAGTANETISPIWTAVYARSKKLVVGGSISGLDVRLTSGHTITGEVLRAGKPVVGIYVNAWDADNEWGGGGYTRFDGHFVIAGLVTGGHYRVEINSNQGDYRSTVTLDTDTDLGRIDLRMLPGVIAGSVVGENAANALVLIYDQDGNYVTAATPDKSGQYTVTDLPVGKTYRVDVDMDGDLTKMEFSGTTTLTESSKTGVVDFVNLRADYAYLNRLRVRAGMTEYKMSPLLERSASNHAGYLASNRAKGHDESVDLTGYSGVAAVDRSAAVGYVSRLVEEGVVTGIGTAMTMIDDLFSGIYHRLALLGMIDDQIGLGFAAVDGYTALVHNSGNSRAEWLCKGVAYAGVEAVYGDVCTPAIKIQKSTYDTALRGVQEQNPVMVVWPVADVAVRPVFFEEQPDPLPGISESGYPISVQFNAQLATNPRVTSFRLFRVTDNTEITSIQAMSQATDPNNRFSAHEFAWFPLKRLDWNTEYRVEMAYSYGSTATTKTWTFKTRDPGVSLQVLTQPDQELVVDSGVPVAVYSDQKAKMPNFGSFSWVAPNDVVVGSVAIDIRTVTFTVTGASGKSVLVRFANGGLFPTKNQVRRAIIHHSVYRLRY